MKSSTLLCCEHAAIQPTKRSRAKRKPVLFESQVKTFDYTGALNKTISDRLRARRVYG